VPSPVLRADYKFTNKLILQYEENHNIISLTENGPSVKGIEEFVIGLSEMVGVEISGYEYTYKGNENISNIFICRYRSSKDRPSRWNTQTKAHSPLDLKLIGVGLDGIDVITHFHTHLSSFPLYNRLNPSGLEDGTGDIQFKKHQEIFGIKNFIILTKGYPKIYY